MPDLTPDRLARLRVWAERRRPGRPHPTHAYDSLCPWCRGDDDVQTGDHGGYFDGNAHDLALELLGEIERLRGIIRKVAANGGIGTLDRGELRTWSAVVATESERVD